MKRKIKLGPKAKSFSDPEIGVFLGPGDVVEIPRLTHRIKQALMKRGLIEVKETQKEKPPKDSEEVPIPKGETAQAVIDTSKEPKTLELKEDQEDFNRKKNR